MTIVTRVTSTIDFEAALFSPPTIESALGQEEIRAHAFVVSLGCPSSTVMSGERR